MDKMSPIFVAGHNGMVGSAIVRKLKALGYNNLVLKSSKELDLRSQAQVESFFENTQIDYVFLAAAKVGGIHANNQYPAEFIYDNLMIQNNVIHNAYKNNVKKLLFLGSSCIYPKYSNQPIKEEYLLTGSLEPTNEAYALAKISGLKMCEFYHKQYGFNAIAAMPTNLYGPHDNFDLETSHVLPALIRKIHEAKINNQEFVEVWGTGKPLREFMYVEDLAEALVFLMEFYNENQFVNIGTGEDISILDLANLIIDIVGYEGTIQFDSTKPDGTPRKLLDVSRLKNLGFISKTLLEEGIRKTYQWYLKEGLES
jgi:GDP-L-fucose synthase